MRTVVLVLVIWFCVSLVVAPLVGRFLRDDGWARRGAARGIDPLARAVLSGTADHEAAPVEPGVPVAS